jgi:hypothetical protein
VAIIDPMPNADGHCVCGIYNKRIGIAVTLTFKKKQLPWLSNWQHWGQGEYVTGLEPGTHPPVGQAKARADNTLLFVAPGERKIYDLEFAVLQGPEDIQRVLSKLGD